MDQCYFHQATGPLFHAISEVDENIRNNKRLDFLTLTKTIVRIVDPYKNGFSYHIDSECREINETGKSSLIPMHTYIEYVSFHHAFCKSLLTPGNTYYT
jgi:hypothetical protein